MHRSILFLLGIILFIYPSATAQVRKPDKDSLLIATKMKTLVKDFNDLNWDSFHASFDENISAFLESDTLTLVKGRKGVEQIFKSLFDDVRKHAKGPPYLHIVPENMLIQVTGRTAIATFHMTRGNFISRRTFVWNKEKRNWLIVHINGSSVEIPKQ